eukprot:365507-Chlamydomonas_euryale.AAC.4
MGRVRDSGASVDRARTQLATAAAAGLRTLCVAQRTLTQQQWATYETARQRAAAGVAGGESEGESEGRGGGRGAVVREAALARAAERLESDLELLGVTAVEDKLQDGVPEAIRALREAGIKVCVCVGGGGGRVSGFGRPGVTAVEDKLQDGVPEAICAVHEAGIKVCLWGGGGGRVSGFGRPGVTAVEDQLQDGMPEAICVVHEARAKPSLWGEEVCDVGGNAHDHGRGQPA